jgi:hypothetical protein
MVKLVRHPPSLPNNTAASTASPFLAILVTCNPETRSKTMASEFEILCPNFARLEDVTAV